MLGDLESRFAGNRPDELFQIVAFEERSLAALPAQQQVLVPGRRRDKCLAALRLVDALDQPLFRQRFQRSINCDQSQRGMCGAGLIVNLDGGDGVPALRHDLHHSPARGGETVALSVQLDKPGMFTNVAS